MNIRRSTLNDLPRLMTIYATAKDFMRRNGNPHQWEDSYPSEELIRQEISQGNSFVCEDFSGEITATFCFSVGEDPTYARIEGQWLNNASYGVIHRLASDGKVKGIARLCIGWCFERHPNLRADTHRDNLIMQKALEANGFRKCGIIYTRESPRIAYQKIQ